MSDLKAVTFFETAGNGVVESRHEAEVNARECLNSGVLEKSHGPEYGILPV